MLSWMKKGFVGPLSKGKASIAGNLFKARSLPGNILGLAGNTAKGIGKELGRDVVGAGIGAGIAGAGMFAADMASKGFGYQGVESSSFADAMMGGAAVGYGFRQIAFASKYARKGASLLSRKFPENKIAGMGVRGINKALTVANHPTIAVAAGIAAASQGANFTSPVNRNRRA